MNNNNLECVGCRQYYIDGCVIRYTFIYEKQVYSCPCHSCLIKGICDNYCEKLRHYILKYYEFVKNDPSEYHKYTERMKSSSIPLDRYNTKHMKGVPSIVKYKDAREMTKQGNEIGSDLLDVGRC